MKAVGLVLACCAFAVTCWGQTPSPSLAENISIRLAGSIGDNTPVEVRLTGAGPHFMCALADPAMRVEYRLEQAPAAKYVLSYDIKMQVPVQAQGPRAPLEDGRPAPVVYRMSDIGVAGKVVVAFDEEVKIATINGKDLTLAISRYGKAPVATLAPVFRGVSLATAPAETNPARLPDIWHAVPPGSRSYEVRKEVQVVYSGLDGTVYYIPEKHAFYIRRDPAGSSTMTFYGPFQGDPRGAVDQRRTP